MSRILLLLLTVLAAASCSPKLTPFTSSLIERNNWDEEDLKKIQFYLSQDVVLQREIRKNSSEIVMGEIVMKGGREVDQITFKAGTPGVLIQQARHEKLAISFENGDDQRFLIFTPHPKKNGTFVLSARNWDKGSGQINYGGGYYYTIPGSGLASLMVDLKASQTNTVKSREASGRKVN